MKIELIIVTLIAHNGYLTINITITIENNKLMSKNQVVLCY